MSGEVVPGYERVQQVFEREAGLLGLGGGAYAAYVDGRPVVDVWAGEKRPGVPWDRDTTTVLFSATKGLAGLCMQILYDRGELDVEAPIAKYWPEFAANGKAAALVKHIPLHSLGVLGLPGSAQILSWQGNGWDDYDGIATALASATPSWEPGTKHGYHAVTYGWLAGELIRRISGVTVGQFFDKEVAQPLALDTRIGTPLSMQDNVAHVYGLSAAGLPKSMAKFHAQVIEKSKDPNEMYGEAFLGDGINSGIAELEQFFRRPEILSAELPFGGATSSARSMAKLFSLLANGGDLDGVHLLSKESIEFFSRVVGNARDELSATLDLPWMLRSGLNKPMPRTLGFMGNQVGNPVVGDLFGPNPRSCGVQGLGGQVAFFDPDNNVSGAFVRSDSAIVDTLYRQVTESLYECLADNGALRTPLPTLSGRAQLGHRLGGRYMRRVQRRANAAAAIRRS